MSIFISTACESASFFPYSNPSSFFCLFFFHLLRGTTTTTTKGEVERERIKKNEREGKEKGTENSFLIACLGPVFLRLHVEQKHIEKQKFSERKREKMETFHIGGLCLYYSIPCVCLFYGIKELGPQIFLVSEEIFFFSFFIYIRRRPSLNLFCIRYMCLLFSGASVPF